MLSRRTSAIASVHIGNQIGPRDTIYRFCQLIEEIAVPHSYKDVSYAVDAIPLQNGRYRWKFTAILHPQVSSVDFPTEQSAVNAGHLAARSYIDTQRK